MIRFRPISAASVSRGRYYRHIVCDWYRLFPQPIFYPADKRIKRVVRQRALLQARQAFLVQEICGEPQTFQSWEQE